MKRAAMAALAAAAFGFGAAETAIAAATPGSFADIAEGLTPAVVNISARQPAAGNASGDLAPLSKKLARRGTSLGSGFIVSPAGHVVTNYHVIDNADEIAVTLADGREFKAKVKGVDREVDIAVLQLEAPGVRFPTVAFGDSAKSRVGDWVIAVGNPFGLGGTVTVGIISAFNRSNVSGAVRGDFDDFIQTDASINRGNSGGPLFDVNGKVIGINTAIYSPSADAGSVGVGFATPSTIAQTTVEQLIKYGETRRGWLGVNINEMTPKQAVELGLDRPKGAVVTSVTAGSPAAVAGVLPEDVILEFNRKPINRVPDLTRAIAEAPAGSTAPLVVLREGKKITLAVKVQQREKRVLAAASGPLPAGAFKGSGLTLQKPTQEIAALYGLEPGIEGVVVTAVDPQSAAAIAFQPGDVILEIGWERVTRPDAAVDKLSRLKHLNSGPVQVYVQRGDLLFYESLRP